MTASSSIDDQSARLDRIERELEAISLRNRRVELEKRWERSRTRIAAIVLLTYALMCLVFWVLGVADYPKSAVIPTFGYYLSTRSLPILKSLWIRRTLENG